MNEDFWMMYDGGTVSLFMPVSDGAKVWVTENITDPETQWLGRCFAVEHRYIDNIVVGIEEAGLTIKQGDQL
jgi:hypothetical protein